MIDVDDLPQDLVKDLRPRATSESPWFEGPWKSAQKRFEREFFRRALADHEGRVADTARKIEVDRKTILNKRKEHGL